MVAVLRRGRHARHDLRALGLEPRRVVIHVRDVDADNNLALAGPLGPLPLYVERVEEQRNLLGRFGCRSLQVDILLNKRALYIRGIISCHSIVRQIVDIFCLDDSIFFSQLKFRKDIRH